jgi:nucleotide-binding universal stress UspA family protein
MADHHAQPAPLRRVPLSVAVRFGQPTAMIARPSTFELGKDGPSIILVGVDGSPSSTRARAYAVGLARRQHARLVAVHARPACSAFDLVPEAAALARQARDELVDELRRDIGEASTYDRQQIEFWVRDGDPARELLAVAEHLCADALVVGGLRTRRTSTHRLPRQPPR